MYAKLKVLALYCCKTNRKQLLARRTSAEQSLPVPRNEYSPRASGQTGERESGRRESDKFDPCLQWQQRLSVLTLTNGYNISMKPNQSVLFV